MVFVWIEIYYLSLLTGVGQVCSSEGSVRAHINSFIVISAGMIQSTECVECDLPGSRPSIRLFFADQSPASWLLFVVGRRMTGRLEIASDSALNRARFSSFILARPRRFHWINTKSNDGIKVGHSHHRHTHTHTLRRRSFRAGGTSVFNFFFWIFFLFLRFYFCNFFESWFPSKRLSTRCIYITLLYPPKLNVCEGNQNAQPSHFVSAIFTNLSPRFVFFLVTFLLWNV